MLPNGSTLDLLRGRGVHLGELPAVLADRYGDRVALEHDAPVPGLDTGGVRSFAALEDATARLAAAHRARGVDEGDRVLVVVPNRVDILLHAFALARLGAVAVPVNHRLKAGEVAAVARASGASTAIADVATVTEHHEFDVDTDLDWVSTDEGPDSIASWLAQHPDARVEALAGRDPRQTALLLTTSGTTGVPKAAALTSQGLLSSVGRLVGVPLGRQRGLRSGRDMVAAGLPLTHVMGFAVALGCMSAGVPLLLRERFEAADMLDVIERRRPNVFVGVPTMYADLDAAGAAGRDLRSVQLWISAADAMPTERARRFQRYGAVATVAGRPVGSAVFVDIYGMVELSGAAAVRLYPPTVTGRVELPAVSVVLPGIEVRAVDPAGDPVGWGAEGELQFRGAGVLERYEGVDGAGPDESGWFSTGDHGRIWPGGVFAFSGRNRDRLQVGGFSVFPAEIEEELHDAPGVAEVAVVGVADDRLGERPVALVVPARTAAGAAGGAGAGEGFDTDAFLAWAHDRVAGYRRPQQVLVVDALPHGNHRKIDRAAATELAEKLLAKESS